MVVSATGFRKDIYRLLDRTAESGIPLEIEHKGRRLQLTCSKSVDKFSKLTLRKVMAAKPDSLIHLDWSSEWEK